jgi:hypothetical protein
MTTQAAYPKLEQNHRVEIDQFQTVICPYTNPNTGRGFETTWSLKAQASEINCLFCEYLKGEYPENPDHGGNQ